MTLTTSNGYIEDKELSKNRWNHSVPFLGSKIPESAVWRSFYGEAEIANSATFERWLAEKRSQLSERSCPCRVSAGSPIFPLYIDSVISP